MAMTSGFYLLSFKQSLAGGYTGLATIWDAIQTHKIMLHSDTYTPNHATDHANANTGEVSGGSPGWPTGGQVLSTANLGSALSPLPSVAVTGSGETSLLTYDMGDVAIDNCQFSSATGCVIFGDAASGGPVADPRLLSVAWTPAASPNGRFTIQWNTAGVWTLDLIP